MARTVIDSSRIPNEGQMTLPMWPQAQRGLPNAFARSALFGVANVRKGERANMKRAVIASLKGIQITYTGEELRQDDEDVFLQILHIARIHALGEEVKFTANAMIVELGWTRNSTSYQRLVDSLDRMKASAVSVTVEGSNAKENYTGSLIRSFRWREDGTNTQLREWSVLLEPEIVTLFNPQSYSRIDWGVRLKLPPLAKWLHSFYHSHAHPYPFKVATFYELTGSRTTHLYQFRYKLKEALGVLVEHGFLSEAHVCPRTDLVTVKRADTGKRAVEHVG